MSEKNINKAQELYKSSKRTSIDIKNCYQEHAKSQALIDYDRIVSELEIQSTKYGDVISPKSYRLSEETQKIFIQNGFKLIDVSSPYKSSFEDNVFKICWENSSEIPLLRPIIATISVIIIALFVLLLLI